MNILAIDYGKKKIGLAIGDDSARLAEPLNVIRYEVLVEGIQKIKQIVQKNEVKQIVIGIPEGKIKEEAEEFGMLLRKELQVPVAFQDETLSTKEAQSLSIDAGIKRKKRKSMEDAYAATLILQSYFDS